VAFWSLAMLMSWRTLLSVALGYIILTKSCTSEKKTKYNTGAARKQYVAIAWPTDIKIAQLLHNF